MLARGIEEQLVTDLQFTRQVLEMANNFALNMIFNTVEIIVRKVPGLAEAFYGDEELHKRTLAEVVAAALSRQDDAGDRMIAAFERWDDRAVELYREWLIERADADRDELYGAVYR